VAHLRSIRASSTCIISYLGAIEGSAWIITLLGSESQFGQCVNLGIVLPGNFSQYDLVKVGLIFAYLIEVFHHSVSLGFKLSLDMAHHNLGIAPDLHIRSSHLSSYG